MKFFLIALAIAVACVVAAEAWEEESYGEKKEGGYGSGMYRSRYGERYEGGSRRYGGMYEGRYGGRYEDRDEYNDKYDNKGLDEMMSNKKLMQDYCKCMLEQGKCTEGGSKLKYHMSEALQNGCSRCSDRQRNGMRRIMGYYMKNEKDMWQQMVRKYDPKRMYSSKYEKEMGSY